MLTRVLIMMTEDPCMGLPFIWVPILFFGLLKKQALVSQSRIEAKYKSLTNVACEIMWIRALLHELHISLLIIPLIWYDNLNIVQIVAYPLLHHA